ncbi:hypothetical protein HOY82DRAFT_597513 [Tuber indicum]|nr:hypothetical protein HOY82DRAFT_597513 [Tuber indicum]
MKEYQVSLTSRMGTKSKDPVGTAIVTHKRSPSASPLITVCSGIDEPEYEVAVRFSDIQGDHNSPFSSVKIFEDLGLSKDLLEVITGLVLSSLNPSHFLDLTFAASPPNLEAWSPLQLRALQK